MHNTSALNCRASIVLASLALAACGGSDSVTPAPPAPNKDSTSAVVGPAGGLVVVPSGVAGVEIPANALNQPVTVTVTLIPASPVPGAGPLPTTMRQYPPYYEFVTSPAGATLGPGVRVGVCQVTDPSNKFYPPESTHPRLRLAHTVGNSVELLEPVDVSDFLRCNGVTAEAPEPTTPFARLAARATNGINRLLSSLAPTPIYAAHGGLGGKVKSFSPFAGVDPGPPNVATIFPVSPRGGFLLSDTSDTKAEPPLIIDLVQLGLVAGDIVKLERLGDFSFTGSVPETGTAMIAVFSSTTELLGRLERVRIPGAISAGTPYATNPLIRDGRPTDIPEDFLVLSASVTIPSGAHYLFVGVPDPFFGDNTDTDNNFAIRITPSGFAGIRSTVTVTPSIRAPTVR